MPGARTHPVRLRHRHAQWQFYKGTIDFAPNFTTEGVIPAEGIFWKKHFHCRQHSPTMQKRLRWEKCISAARAAWRILFYYPRHRPRQRHWWMEILRMVMTASPAKWDIPLFTATDVNVPVAEKVVSNNGWARPALLKLITNYCAIKIWWIQNQPGQYDRQCWIMRKALAGDALAKEALKKREKFSICIIQFGMLHDLKRYFYSAVWRRQGNLIFEPTIKSFESYLLPIYKTRSRSIAERD